MLRGQSLSSVDTYGNEEFWPTFRLTMTELERQAAAECAWTVASCRRNLKQFTGDERTQLRLEVSQRNHIGLAIRAFLWA